MFRGPYFIMNTMQAGTTSICNVFGMTGRELYALPNDMNYTNVMIRQNVAMGNLSIL